MISAFAGPAASAIDPNINEEMPNAKLPASEFSELMVAL